jgi:hypothetical protein
MAINHNGIIFPHRYHENPRYGSFARPTSIATWHGVMGAQIRLGRSKTREITLNATLSYFATEIEFNNARRNLETYLDQGLRGPLQIGATSFPTCVFLGWEPGGQRDGEAWYSPQIDQVGLQGWTQTGVLRWVEIKTWI